MITSLKIIISETVRWVYWYPFRWIAERVPLHWTYPLVKITARILFLIPQSKFRKIQKGLEKLFPWKSKSKIARITYQTYENYLLNACESFWYPKLNRQLILEMIDFDGLGKIDQALRSGKGVILAHGHFGNEELLMPAIGYMGYKAHQLASRWEPLEYNGFLSLWVNWVRKKAFEKRIGYRESFPVNFHYVDKNLRPAIRCLESNEILLFAVDGREGTKWNEYDFLGRKARFSPGLDHIARLTNAIILPIFIIRQPNYRHQLIVLDPLNAKNNCSDLTDKFTQILDELIRKKPEQYAKVYFLVDDFFVS